MKLPYGADFPVKVRGHDRRRSRGRLSHLFYGWLGGNHGGDGGLEVALSAPDGLATEGGVGLGAFALGAACQVDWALLGANKKFPPAKR